MRGPLTDHVRLGPEFPGLSPSILLASSVHTMPLWSVEASKERALIAAKMETGKAGIKVPRSNEKKNSENRKEK